MQRSDKIIRRIMEQYAPNGDLETELRALVRQVRIELKRDIRRQKESLQ